MTEKLTCKKLEKRIQEFERRQTDQELHESEERLSKINACFIQFTPDVLENINRLTSLCGELLGATCALYNRLDHGLLCSWGQWNTPSNYNPVDKPDGHICYDVIKNTSDEVLVVSDLQETPYAQTDPNVVPFRLQTYVGKAVKFFDTYIGSLCVVFQDDFVPSEADKKLMGIIAAAIGVEEERRQVKEDLRHQTAMHKILMNISSNYINVPLDDVQNVINAALGAIGKFVSADRAYVFNYDFQKNVAVNTYEWCNEGSEPQIDNLQSSPLEAAPDWVASHLKGEPVTVADTSTLPLGDMRNILEQQQIKSLITVPMFHDERLVGFTGFDSVKKFHIYSDMEIELIKFFGQILINLRMRIQSEEGLEVKIKERTVSLEEMNAALHVLLKKREQDKDDIESKMLSNVKILIRPCLQALKKSSLNDSHKELVQILEANINEVVAPFSHKMSALNINLSHMEIQVANLVRQGKTNKEIAQILSIASKTVAFHRNNIRRKLCLTNTKTNLRSFLSTLS